MDQRIKVVPNSLNYSDIKPESIQTDIRLTKFIPTATVTNAQPGDVIKMLISGTGFLDPYSTYLDFTIDFGDNANFVPGEMRFLDRSAHSFISQILIRSQGQELERIQDYDVMAAMLNDMIYSNEQAAFHQWEGFPSQSMSVTKNQFNRAPYTTTIVNDEASLPGFNSQGLQGRNEIIRLHHTGSNPIVPRFMGEHAFFNELVAENATIENTDEEYAAIVNANNAGGNVNFPAGRANVPLSDSRKIAGEFLDFAYHDGGYRDRGYIIDGNGNQNYRIVYTARNTARFCIPIYSTIMGILMQEKKLIPLGLLPLDIEFTLNKEALYSALAVPGMYTETNMNTLGATAAERLRFTLPIGSRSYRMVKFALYGNLIFFETDVHRQVEVQTTERGLFIYCNSFKKIPTAQLGLAVLPETHLINSNLKSVNSLHWVFINNKWRQQPQMRKLHFLSHNLRSLQFRNGQNRYPLYPIEGDAGTSINNEYVPFFLETLRAYGKVHDPTAECALSAFNFCGDTYMSQMLPPPWNLTHLSTQLRVNSYLAWIEQKQGNVGRCQYAISLEGEELGQDKQIITGKKFEQPCIIEMKGTKSNPPVVLSQADGPNGVISEMFLFARYDFVVYVRPDMQVVLLGI